MALSSLAFSQYPLTQYGLQWIQPTFPLAHALDNGEAAILDRSIERTSQNLGGEREYVRIASALTKRWPQLSATFLRPIFPPRHPFLMARFGLHAASPATWEARKVFASTAGRALFGGMAAHSNLALSTPVSAAFGWVLALAAHAVGWPIPRGGSQSIANALGAYFESLGGTIVKSQRVRSLSELSSASLVLCDVGVQEFLAIAGNRLDGDYRKSLDRFRPGPAAFKIDWALSNPIPWRNSQCKHAGTVHLGGTFDEIAASERAVWHGKVHPRPFVLLAQPSLFDSSRAPGSAHTAWAYCHVPNGCRDDVTEQIEAQVERFAPGFRKQILAKHLITPDGFEQMNPNYTGGDILGGAQTALQLAFRPTRHLYWTPIKGVYLCSASTPPGGGVHGMCGYYAAKIAIKENQN